jgi:hypothetical protein
VSRNFSKEARPRQQSIRQHEEPHPRHVHIRHGISASRMPPMQCSQGGHAQLQSPFPQRPGGCSWWLSPKPMGPATPTNRDHDQPHLRV